MGIFNFVLLSILAIGSFARDTPINVQKTSLNSLDNVLYEGKQWVVLVAGTSGWDQYRHQADICHAYQIVKSNGIPEENIITMMVDDIANNIRNPMRGKIYNKPHKMFRGKDVYRGIKIDYKGSDVNSKNFLNIITGNKTAMQYTGSGKVIEGGPHDSIFINFVTYGTSGVLTFPDSFLFADELDNAFNDMYINGNFAKILLYVEASYSGTMFDGILNENANILAVTATGPKEKSHACYYVGFPYYTFLGERFGVAWMELWESFTGDYYAADITVFEDYSEVRGSIGGSNVMIYGDYSVGSDSLSSFIGYLDKEGSNVQTKITNKTAMDVTATSDVIEYSIRDRLTDNKLTTLEKYKLEMKQNKNNRMRLIIDRTFRKIYSKIIAAKPEIRDIVGEYDGLHNPRFSLNIFDCYRNILNTITEHCFSLTKNPYSLDLLNRFADICIADNQIHGRAEEEIRDSCKDIPNNIVNVF